MPGLRLRRPEHCQANIFMHPFLFSKGDDCRQAKLVAWHASTNQDGPCDAPLANQSRVRSGTPPVYWHADREEERGERGGGCGE